MKKYEYKYVNISISRENKQRKIIDQYAANGYRYIGYIPSEISPYEGSAYMDIDLIFEKELES